MLEGLWQEGFMAIAAIGATNIGSIEVCEFPYLTAGSKVAMHFLAYAEPCN